MSAREDALDAIRAIVDGSSESAALTGKLGSRLWLDHILKKAAEEDAHKAFLDGKTPTRILGDALAFYRCAVKRGEHWGKTCDKIWDRSIHALKALGEDRIKIELTGTIEQGYKIEDLEYEKI